MAHKIKKEVKKVHIHFCGLKVSPAAWTSSIEA
jgi:hypothetical protein